MSSREASMAESIMQRVDAICDRFEAAWKASATDPPRIEVYLDGVAELDRTAALAGLLAVEQCYRPHDPGFAAEAFAARMPADAAAIGAWFDSRRAAVMPATDIFTASDERSTTDGDESKTNAREQWLGGSRAEIPALPTPGRFRKLRPHAEGGMGRVSEAHDAELDRRVALKEIRSHLADRPDVRARFEQEARITGSLEHPNIAPVYSLNRDSEGRPFYAMRFLEGETLADAIAAWHVHSQTGGDDPGRRLALRKLLGHFVDVCNAVEYAHSRGVLHRDLKPPNVMLGKFGETIVLDWGFARRSSDDVAAWDGLPRPSVPDDGLGRPSHGERQTGGVTQMGDRFGTPGYMSPEQAAGRHDLMGAASDVYALGGTLYCLLTGKPPLEGDDRGELLRKTEQGEIPPAGTIKKDVPRGLDAICTKALAHDPGDRFPTARALADDVERWLSDEPLTAYRDPLVARMARWARRHRARAAGGAAILLTSAVSLAVGAALLTNAWSRTEEQRKRVAEQRKLVAEQRELADKRGKLADERAELAEGHRRLADEQRELRDTQLQRQRISQAVDSLKQRRATETDNALDLVPIARHGWECDRLRYMADLGPRVVEAMAGHDWGVLSLLLSADGTTLVTSGHDGRLLIWNIGSDDPLELQTGSWSNERLAWRHARFDFKDEPPGELVEDCFVKLCWFHDGNEFLAASYGRDDRGRGVLWTRVGTDKWTPRELFGGHDRPLTAVATDGERILFGDDRGALIYLETAAGEHRKLALLKDDEVLEDGEVLDIVALPNGYWGVGQADGTVSLLNADASRVLGQTRRRPPIWDLELSPDGWLLAVADGSQTVTTYALNMSEGGFEPRSTFQLPTESVASARAVQSLRFSPDGQMLAAGDDLGRLVFWSKATGETAFVKRTTSVLRPDQADELPRPFRRRLAEIEFSAGGESCYTAGLDPVVRRWRTTALSGNTTLRFAAGALVRFDPMVTHLLWCAEPDGTLALFDSFSGARLAAVAAHERTINAVDVAQVKPVTGNSGGTLVATSGDEQTIRFWHAHGEKIEAADERIQHDRPLVNLAVSPDGELVAAYDAGDRVCVWRRATSELLAQRSLAEEPGKPHFHGRVAFNSDGSQLAVLGPQSSMRVFTAESLSEVARPYSVAGTGGTALAWHATEPGTVFAGDNLGRLSRHPITGWGEIEIPGNMPATVRGLAVSLQGVRLAAAAVDGTVWIVDPRWAGHLLTLRSAHADETGAQVTDLSFDQPGKRLALLHDDGTFEIWETERRRPPPSRVPPERRWSAECLDGGPELRGMHLRSEATTLDGQNQLALLYSIVADEEDAGPEVYGRTLVFGRQFENRWRTDTFDDKGIFRSLALAWTGTEFFATVRKPLRPPQGSDGTFGLLRRKPGDASWSEEPLVAGVHNLGFDTQIGLPVGERPQVAYFSHAGSYLETVNWDGSSWRREKLGRQGDGFGFLGAWGRDRALHAVFRPSGLAGNNHLVYLNATDESRKEQHREVLERVLPAHQYGLAIDAHGAPNVLYMRGSDQGGLELILARRETEGWRKFVVLAEFPLGLSNLLANADGSFSFAYCDGGRPEIMLATGRDDAWAAEPVGIATPLPEASKEASIRSLVLLADSRNSPVVVAVSGDGAVASLWIFRPDGK